MLQVFLPLAIQTSSLKSKYREHVKDAKVVATWQATRSYFGIQNHPIKTEEITKKQETIRPESFHQTDAQWKNKNRP